MEEQDAAAGAQCAEEKEEVEEMAEADVSAPEAEEEDEESLPHPEILDIFEEGLAQLVQDPLLCDLPIQVIIRCCVKKQSHSSFIALMSPTPFNSFY